MVSDFRIFIIVIVVQISVASGFSFDDALRIHLHGYGDSSDKIPISINYFQRTKRDASHYDNQHYVEVMLDDQKLLFELEKNPHLLGDNILTSEHDDCVFQGKSLFPNNTFLIALTGCEEREMHGIILTSTDEFYLLQPPAIHKPYFNGTTQSHTIQKRSANIHDHHSACGFDLSKDPYPEDRHHDLNPEFLAVHRFDDLVIELGVFVDDAMWMFFEKLYNSDAEKEVRRFVIAAVNNIDILFTRTTMDPKVRLKITHFEILKHMPMPLTRTYHSSGDVTKMLNSFCTYQASINPSNDADPKHWDHALLLTGYDLYRDGVKTIAGYAPVKGMCEQVLNKSCTVNEGLDFGAVFVIAHEMGHSLGMYHDGESNRCHPRCCIMSPSIGAGKTQWSDCSVSELHVFVSKLGSGNRPMNCLIDDRGVSTERVYTPKKDLPGQQYSLDEQCSLFHGTCWKHELQTGQTMKDVCDMVWCTNGESIVRNTHPALEGSYCGPGGICIEGKCINAAAYGVAMTPLHGGFGDWDDASKCSAGCNDCKIEGQLRVKRAVRMCNKPFALNGGKGCQGSDIRGVICGKDACKGLSPDAYATQKCTTLKADPNLFHIGLTGKGLQFMQGPCKVWCHLGAKDIRTMADLPDGTPCGKEKYCLRGECMSLTCTKRTIVKTPADCPVAATPRKEPLAKREIIDFSKIDSRWSPWSPWTECVASGCGEVGIQERTRECLSKECLGARRQRSECIKTC